MTFPARLCFVVLLVVSITILPSQTQANTQPCDADLFEVDRTESVIYLRRSMPLADYTLQFRPDGGGGDVDVHELGERIERVERTEETDPIVNNSSWHTAIWVDRGQTGQLLVTRPAGTCEFALPGYQDRIKPEYARTIVATPANIDSTIDQVNQSGGQVELILEDGEYHAGDFEITVSDINIVARNRYKAIFNGESTRTLRFERIVNTDVYRTIHVPPSFVTEIRQVHVDYDWSIDIEKGEDPYKQLFKAREKENKDLEIRPLVRVERLPSVSTDSDNRKWTVGSLNLSPNGGWFVEDAVLYVKMPSSSDPDNSDPNNKVHVTGPYQKAFGFSGNNVWVEGLIFRHYGRISFKDTRENHNLVSGLYFAGDTIDVRHNRFEYNRGHAIVFGCEVAELGIGCSSNTSTKWNTFKDNQKYLTYKQARLSNESGQEKGQHLRPSDRVLYWRTKGFTHNENFHSGALQGVAVVGATAGEVSNNRLFETRNISIGLLDAEETIVVRDEDGNIVLNGNGVPIQVKKIKVSGHSLTVAQNSFKNVGYALPNNEEQAQTGPSWWINNCVVNYGWPGNNTNDDVLGNTPQSNRYGVILKPIPQPIAIHLVYNNVISSTVNSPSYKKYDGWSFNGQHDFHPGTRFYNNVWTSYDSNATGGNIVDTKSIIWRAEITRLLLNGPSAPVDEDHLLSRTKWDHNQYWLSGVGDQNTTNPAFGFGRTFEEVRALPYNFEPNGSYSNPGAISEDCTVESPIEHKYIAGVIGNSYLGLGE